MNNVTAKLTRWMAWVAALMLALLPFHAFLTVWVSTAVGHYTAVRLWKEALLALLLGGCLYLFIRWPAARRQLTSQPLFWLIAAFGIILSISGIAALTQGSVTPKAFAYGLLLDARFLLFFVLCWLISLQTDLLRRYWKQLLIVPSVVVVIVALLQFFVLPVDVLKHFGYGPDTIPAVSTVDQKVSFQRIQSTLRGANPLGAYMVLIISALAIGIIKARKLVWRQGLILGLGVVTLAVTFSRSAWVGALASGGWIVWTTSRAWMRRWLVITGCLGLLVCAGVGYQLRDNNQFQNTFFHTDETSRSAISSNTGRYNSLKSGSLDLLHEPLGRGTGTAGPASVYNGDHGVRMSENYFIQIGQEVGVVGLSVFVAINVLLARNLWRSRDDELAMALLASFVGITIINMLSHAWADDTLSYIWWGLAGVAVAGVAVDRKKAKE